MQPRRNRHRRPYSIRIFMSSKDTGDTACDSIFEEQKRYGEHFLRFRILGVCNTENHITYRIICDATAASAAVEVPRQEHH